MLFNVSCIVSQKKKNVNIIQGNLLTTKHILNLITNVFTHMLTLQDKTRCLH